MSNQSRRFLDSTRVNNENPRGGRGVWLIIVLGIFIVAVLAATYILNYYQSMETVYTSQILLEDVDKEIPQKNATNIILIAIDTRERDGSQVDEAIWASLLTIHSKYHKMKQFNLPLNLEIEPERSFNDIYGHEGIPGLKQAIGQQLDFPVDFFIRIHIKQIRYFVQAIGGLDIVLDEDYSIGELHLEAGQIETLTATQVDQILRSTDGESYLVTYRRQRNIIEAISQYLSSFENLANLPASIQNLAGVVDSDLPFSQMLQLFHPSNDIIRINIEERMGLEYNQNKNNYQANIKEIQEIVRFIKRK